MTWSGVRGKGSCSSNRSRRAPGLALGRRQRAHELPLLEQGGLKDEGLLPPQRLARLFDLILEIGAMDALESGARVKQAVAQPQGLRKRVVDGRRGPSSTISTNFVNCQLAIVLVAG